MTPTQTVVLVCMPLVSLFLGYKLYNTVPITSVFLTFTSFILLILDSLGMGIVN